MGTTYKVARVPVAERDAGDVFVPRPRPVMTATLQIIVLALLALLVIVTSTCYIVS